MFYKQEITKTHIGKKLNLGSLHFANHKYAYYKWLRENDPVHQGKVFRFLNVNFVSRYEDCLFVLKDSRFVRNRSTAVGGNRKSPIPLPKSVQLLSDSMINLDNPEHRRLRNLVHKSFSTRQLSKLETKIEALAHSLLDQLASKKEIELKEDFARPIPVTVIAEMMGVPLNQMPEFTSIIDTVVNGFSGFKMIHTIFSSMPKSVQFVRQLIETKKSNPGEDILTGLIEAEEEGEKLTEDELVAMVFLIIVAGYETTYNLITNAIFTLLQHPQQFEELKSNLNLIPTVVDEVLRFNNPIQGTKLQYAKEDLQIGDTPLKKGSPVMALLGSANHDPTIFSKPENFNWERSNKKHLSFGMGIHYCLGAPLAKMETHIALRVLLERFPNFKAAKPLEEIKIRPKLGWHEYLNLPLLLS